MGLEFRTIVECDKSYHDNVNDDWKEAYYILKTIRKGVKQ